MKHGYIGTLSLALVASGSLFAASSACGRTPPEYGFQWSTIGDVGNAPYLGPDMSGVVRGRGQVNYSYRISTLEISTAQWMEFVNTYSTQSNDLTFFAEPSNWGATPDPTYFGPGRRWILDERPSDSHLPVGGISWRDAAKYCNWLTNGKGSSLSAIQKGAYDTSTFITNPDTNVCQNQDTHSPGAKYWIPTLDEWIKAVHYDPNHEGPGKGGWWKEPNGSDVAPIPGLPGVGETSAGYKGFGPFEEWAVPLGAYPNTKTPWGLLDATGGASEWMEDWSAPINSRQERYLDGACTGKFGSKFHDQIDGIRSLPPWAPSSVVGLRIASSVPAPGTTAILATASALGLSRRRFRSCK